METVVSNRRQTAFRLRADLLDRLRVKAKKENRSLNNYVESVLLDAVFDDPNDETLAAMKEADNLTKVDMPNYESFLKSLE